jgi:signal transduction histidine kinase
MPNTPDQYVADILVVDDAPANLQLLFGMLKDRGYRVRPVPSGKLALQAARARSPDLILLDVNMPEMSGFETCALFKADPGLRDIPVIFVSALSEPFDKVQAFAGGAVDYVTKPFHLDEVRVRVETHLALSRLHARLEAQNQELAAANDRLRALEDARKVLEGAIVHDLKSPLAAIIGNIEYLLHSGDLRGEPREVLGEMLASSNQIHRIVLNLLDVARMEDAEIVPKRADVRLGAILDRARATAQLHARMTGHRLVVDADPEQVVVVDADLVTRVIENLLDNSLKYAPRGTQIKIIARPDDRRGMSLRVEDRGSGVPVEQREVIFERYVRLEQHARQHTRSSRGLGLAFCRLAVEAHGGKIWVEDTASGGAAFCANIPGPASTVP